MSWSRQANRRLLFSIISAPAQSLVKRSLPNRLPPLRTLTTSLSRRNDGSTFSFGEAGDSIIAELASKQRYTDGHSEVKHAQRNRKKQRRPSKQSLPETMHSVEREPGSSMEQSKASLKRSLKQAKTESSTDQNPTLDSEARETLKEKKRKDTSTRKARPRVGIERSSPARGSSKPPRNIDIDMTPTPKQDLPDWAVQKQALATKFGDDGWNPRRKLSPDAMLGIRNMHQSDPITYSTPVLAQQFKVSAEAIRRILRSKWLGSAPAEKVQERRQRWAKRHDSIWDQQAALGLRPARRQERRPRDAAEGADEVEEELLAKETLRRAREENPL